MIMLRIIIVKARALQKLRTPDTAEQNPLRSEFTNHAPANHRTASGASESPCWNPSRAQVILIVFKTPNSIWNLYRALQYEL